MKLKTKEEEFPKKILLIPFLAVKKTVSMSLSSPPSIAFFQPNELVKKAEALIEVVGWVVENIFSIEERVSEQLTNGPFSV